jgi:hypothetical protein
MQADAAETRDPSKRPTQYPAQIVRKWRDRASCRAYARGETDSTGQTNATHSARC